MRFNGANGPQPQGRVILWLLSYRVSGVRNAEYERNCCTCVRPMLMILMWRFLPSFPPSSIQSPSQGHRGVWLGVLAAHYSLLYCGVCWWCACTRISITRISIINVINIKRARVCIYHHPNLLHNDSTAMRAHAPLSIALPVVSVRPKPGVVLVPGAVPVCRFLE